MNRNTMTIAAALAGAAVVVVLFVLLARAGDAPAPGTGGGESAEAEDKPVVLPTPREVMQSLSWATPERSLEAQVRALLKDNRDGFREALLPIAAAQLTDVTYQKCRDAVRAGPIDPQWNAARDEVSDGGEGIKRVRVRGGVEVAFHQVGARWLVDRLWCAEQPASAPR